MITKYLLIGIVENPDKFKHYEEYLISFYKQYQDKMFIGALAAIKSKFALSELLKFQFNGEDFIEEMEEMDILDPVLLDCVFLQWH